MLALRITQKKRKVNRLKFLIRIFTNRASISLTQVFSAFLVVPLKY